MIPAAQIQLPVGSEHHPAGAVVGAMWQAGEDVDGTRQALHRRLIRIAPDLHAKVHAASGIGVVGVRDVDVVRALALEQVRVQSEPRRPSWASV